jgi:hypothetical protein
VSHNCRVSLFLDRYVILGAWVFSSIDPLSIFVDRYVILGNHHDTWVFSSIDPLSIFVDRYVILGNHHDTWVLGSIDPLSGAAGLTEIVHSMGDLLKQGRYCF